MRKSSPSFVVKDTSGLREVRLALIGNWSSLLIELLGKPQRRTARQWRWNRHGSLSAVVSGAKLGTWFDHERGIGGGPLELIAREQNSDWRGAADWARRWLGMPQWQPSRLLSAQDDAAPMLRRPEGATVAQIADATGWAQHTVRGFFAGLKKRQGINVEIAERIRQVGPNKQGAKGSYTVYRVAE